MQKRDLFLALTITQMSRVKDPSKYFREKIKAIDDSQKPKVKLKYQTAEELAAELSKLIRK